MHTRVILLLMMLAALVGITGCNRMHATAQQESAPSYIPPDFSQEELNNLIRQNSPTVRPSPESRMWAHKVRNHRETLFSIALWYTGKGANWPRLVEANPDIDPRRMRIGDTVLIPEKLMKTHRLMPPGFPHPGHKHRETENVRPQELTPPAENDAPPLFGPIENDLQHAEPAKTDLPVTLETLDP
jgi:hypothetical protein